MVRHSGLSGSLYPLHLKPKDDELLSSWIVRLALAHGLSPFEFSRILQPQFQMTVQKMRNIDLGIEKKEFNSLLAALLLRCAVPVERIRETTLSEFRGRLYEQKLDRKTYAWILRHDAKTRSPTQRLAMQACPACLTEDKEPYFRRRWRLAFAVACPQHKSILVDCCCACGRGLEFHLNAVDRVHIKQGTMTVCRECEFDLRDAAIQPPAEPEVIDFQEHLFSVAKRGHVIIRGIENTPSPSYFTLLHCMLSMITDPHELLRHLQSAIYKHYALNLNISHLPVKGAWESLDVGTRYELMWLLHRLLIDHPDRYLGKPYSYSFGATDLSEGMSRNWRYRCEETAFWYVPMVYAERERRQPSLGGQINAKRYDLDTSVRSRPEWLDEAGKFAPNKIVFQRYNTPYGKHFKWGTSYETKQIVQWLSKDGYSASRIARIIDTNPEFVRNWIKEDLTLLDEPLDF